ncbi:MAG: type secretion system protein ImpA [Paraburkholderia sp.]|nr:type secretion system protein ImpA [Paraburkholderia sp.]
MSNNKRQSSKKPALAGASVEAIAADSIEAPTLHDWMAPMEASAPCGADLEYDPEFVVLSAKVVPRVEAQYGDFVGTPDPIHWSDVDRDCRRLMMRSKDMRLAVLFARCRTRLAGATGLAEGIALLAAWLDAFPQALHPQPGADSERDAALEIRMNALQALTDVDGLLGDVREITLTRSTATRLQVRDVERAFAHPRPTDALAPESVRRQLDDLRLHQPAVMAGFNDAHASLAAIEAWSHENLGTWVPDLSELNRLLRHVAGQDARLERATALSPENAPCVDAALVADAADAAAGADAAAPCGPMTKMGASTSTRVSMPGERGARTPPADRHAALERIREARQWFEAHEPSSPIPVLLRRAEQFVGKRYAEVVQAIPAALLAEWESAHCAN